MSVDYLALECIRNVRLEDVAAAIEASLAATGWIAGVSAVEEDRPIQIVADGKWVVIDDRHDLVSTRWAESLTASVGGDAISLRVWEDEYSLLRFADGSLVGQLGNEAANRKALDLRSPARARKGRKRRPSIGRFSYGPRFLPTLRLALRARN